MVSRIIYGKLKYTMMSFETIICNDEVHKNVLTLNVISNNTIQLKL